MVMATKESFGSLAETGWRWYMISKDMTFAVRASIVAFTQHLILFAHLKQH